MKLALFFLALPLFGQVNGPPLPPPKPLEVPPRIGVLGTVNIGLPEVIQRVLESDRDLVISRIAREEAVYNIKGALGVYDPRLGLNAFRSRSVAPVTRSRTVPPVKYKLNPSADESSCTRIIAARCSGESRLSSKNI